jgi:chromosome transmission fidelity protein 1
LRVLPQVCPYYGSRRAVPAVDVVLAPYSSVLLPDACDSLGIQLQGSVVVFDEAHNLLDAINGAHSTAVSGKAGVSSPPWWNMPASDGPLV